MKTVYIATLVVIAGLFIGSGAGYATSIVMRGQQSAKREASTAITFVPTGKIIAPMIFPDGRLAGYVAFLVQLETRSSDAAFVTERLPLLMHGINMRTYRTPLTGDAFGSLPSIDAFRKLVLETCVEAFGRDRVQRVAVVQAMPQ
jgi:hypothetical protein